MMERRARRLLNLLLLSLLPFVGSCVHPTDLSATGRPEPQAAPSEPAAANLKIGALISTPRFTPVPNGFEGIDAEVGGAVAQWLEETPALRGYLRQGQLLAALRTEDIDVAVGILWPDRKSVV